MHSYTPVPLNKQLTAAAELQQKSLKADTLNVRQTAMRELTTWLQSTHAASNRTVMTAIPEGIRVHLTQHWLPKHAGSETAEQCNAV